jgi:Fic family protein
MMTLRKIIAGLTSIPTSTSWYLADLGEALGKQALFTRQSPQRLKVLREHALIESAVSSNRIEGVEVDQKRIGTLVFGKPHLRNRDEEEIQGYRNALKLVHENYKGLPVTEETIKKLHALARGDIWDAGVYKDKDVDIIEKYADGRQRVRFKSVPAAKTPEAMKELILGWDECVREKPIHPLISMAAFNLDFLCIHPFRDGNGRASRLLLLLETYHLGYEVGRYVSLERIIEQNDKRYYETLEQSSTGWHEGRHDPWPYINYLLFILKTAYKEFEERVGQMSSPKGAKTEMIHGFIDRQTSSFRIADLQRECPGVGVDLIRLTLKRFRAQKQIRLLGKGAAAAWEKTKKWEVGIT